VNGNEILHNRQEVLGKVRRVAILVLFILGFGLVGLSLSAEILGLNITPGFGVVQMAQLLAGLSFLTLSGFLQIYTMRLPDAPHSLQADIGVRFAATGLVFCFAAGFADLLQIGTHVPCTDEMIANGIWCGAFIGPWQLGGIGLGIISIVGGLLLYYTSRGTRPASLFSFLIEDE
jgi:hypothetical protein